MRTLFLKIQVFLKIHGSSVPNHNFREVLSEGGCCRRKNSILKIPRLLLL